MNEDTGACSETRVKLEGRLTRIEERQKRDSSKISELHDALIGEDGLYARVRDNTVCIERNTTHITWIKRGLAALTLIVVGVYSIPNFAPTCQIPPNTNNIDSDTLDKITDILDRDLQERKK